LREARPLARRLTKRSTQKPTPKTWHNASRATRDRRHAVLRELGGGAMHLDWSGKLKTSLKTSDTKEFADFTAPAMLTNTHASNAGWRCVSMKSRFRQPIHGGRDINAHPSSTSREALGVLVTSSLGRNSVQPSCSCWRQRSSRVPVHTGYGRPSLLAAALTGRNGELICSFSPTSTRPREQGAP